MKAILRRLVNSFDTKNEGFSGRKLTAFVLILLAGFVHYEADFTQRAVGIEFLCADLVGAFLCLGIITAQHIINFKKAESNEDKQERT